MLLMKRPRGTAFFKVETVGTLLPIGEVQLAFDTLLTHPPSCVTTIGDCYVAVSGLPVPRQDHAIVMAWFARDCLYRLNNILVELEQRLGPDTADLGMRVGLHSGPIIAGVLRGDRARFQLFGDMGKLFTRRN